jgi:hypothetical protein
MMGLAQATQDPVHFFTTENNRQLVLFSFDKKIQIYSGLQQGQIVYNLIRPFPVENRF